MRWWVVAGVFALLLSAGAVRAEWATIVVDPASGRILQAENDRAPRYPASLAKMMTAYLVLEALREKRLTIERKLPISTAAANQRPVKLGLRRGRTIILAAALDATILRSANDAAVVLADAVAGDEARFARRMTRTARRLGMRDTRFTNATGLPQADQVNTAHDMAILARALMRDFPEASTLFSRTSARHGKHRFSTINGWLASYPGADGMKTGFTCAAGYNLVATATRDDRRVLAVMLGGTSPRARSRMARGLVDAAFAAPATAPARLGFLGEPSGAHAMAPPPRILSRAKCANSKSTTRGPLEAGPFPGWGILFGAHGSREKALGHIRDRRAFLGSVAKEGRAAVVAQARAGVTRYKALLVALSKDASLASCRRLRASGGYCLRLDPTRLNNARARWR